MSSLTPIESALLERVTTSQDSEALIQLIDMHTGIYYMIASKYCRTYPDVIKLNDIDDDRMTNMYQWIIQYKPEKEMKLASYIGERTDYLCRDILKRERHNPLSTSVLETLPSGDGSYSYSMNTNPEFNPDSDVLRASTAGHSVTLVDATPAALPAEAANRNIAMEDTLAALENPALGLDPRFKAIFRMRHLDTPTQSWRQIGKVVGLTHEGVRKIAAKGMEKLNHHLNGGKVV